jgi:hypothetical protein
MKQEFFWTASGFVKDYRLKAPMAHHKLDAATLREKYGVVRKRG